MSKPLFTISCPIDTYSGYGARSRDLVKAIIASERYDVEILSQRWGNTRFGYLKDHGEEELLSKIVPNVKQERKPDYWMQITVPNEFQKVGKYNIGVTAGMETTLVAPQWVEGVNRMDLVLTSSKHSKAVFENSIYEITDKRTNQKGALKVTTPIEVVFEGVDTNKYYEKRSTLNLDDIKESFCYLQVGHWLKGDINEDRKNIGYTIKSFLETFKNKQTQPALILKTSHVGTSIIDRENVLNKIDVIRKTVKGKLPNIYLLHGDLSDENMNELYNHPKVKVFVSHTKGEGFGRPLLEFTTTGKPVIASGWSGQVDFLDKDKSILIGGSLDDVHDSSVQKDMILKESKWFKPNDQDVARAYKETFKNYKKYTVPAKKQRSRTLKEFKLADMFVLVDQILKEKLPEFPQQVELNLPPLDLPKI
jgi:glycosyltransferase involved in cell wall biosynthesis